MNSPDLPPAHEPMTAEAVLSRWPTNATKHELLDGALYFYGTFDERDISTAERTYPGRRALINREGALEVHPAGPGKPHSVLDLVGEEHEAHVQEAAAELREKTAPHRRSR
ncbi:hypothetical protein AB0M68_35970 [Streptomyces sp. NPDC051453]|uniref:hypothetical protein n=1 Tax=Streptomyces sp. NPDC051453 TaxID=3154941 RepID=UPI00343EC7E4